MINFRLNFFQFFKIFISVIGHRAEAAAGPGRTTNSNNNDDQTQDEVQRVQKKLAAHAVAGFLATSTVSIIRFAVIPAHEIHVIRLFEELTRRVREKVLVVILLVTSIGNVSTAISPRTLR